MDDMEFRTLRYLSSSGTVHMRRLYRTLGVDLDALKEALSRLKEKGYLREFSHGGFTFFSITEKGAEALTRPESATASSEGEGESPSKGSKKQ